MSDLAAFWNARLAEDEAAAKLAAREGGTWTQDDPDRHPGSISSLGGQVVYDEGAPDEYQAAHIARHDPARALRDVAADRAILAMVEEQDGYDLPEGVQDGRDPDERKRDEALADTLEDVVRIRAAIHRDHPDYRQEWAP